MPAAIVVRKLTSGTDAARLLDQGQDRTGLIATPAGDSWLFMDPDASDPWTVEDRVIDALNWLSATWSIHVKVERQQAH